MTAQEQQAMDGFTRSSSFTFCLDASALLGANSPREAGATCADAFDDDRFNPHPPREAGATAENLRKSRHCAPDSLLPP